MRSLLLLLALTIGVPAIGRLLLWIRRWLLRDDVIDTLIRKPIPKYPQPYDYNQALAAKARRATADQLRRQAWRIDMLEDLEPAASDQAPTERVRAFRRRAR